MKPRHGHLDVVAFEPVEDCVRSLRHDFIHRLSLVGIKPPQHMSRRVGYRPTNPHAQARERVTSEFVDDRAHPVLSPMATLGTNAQLAGFQV